MTTDAREHLQGAQAGAGTTSPILEGLRLLSRATQPELVKSTVDLGRIARAAVERLRRDEPGRDVECIIQEPLIAIGDGDLLAIALNNLLDNAWKFTRRTPHARIELSCLPRNGRSVYVVSDNGAGFDDREARLLFRPFQRLDRQDEFSGVGVGLAAVQRIVSRHGGRIWAEGKPGHGATFSFTL